MNPHIIVNIDSAEVSFRPSRGTQTEGYSLNSHVSKTGSHLHSPMMAQFSPGAEYFIMGLMWHNNEFINNCNTDSFVTFIKIMSLKHPNMLVKCMRLKEDAAESTLKDIIGAYQSVKWHPHLLKVQDALARKAWATNVLGLVPTWGQVIDLAGDEGQHIFDHLRKSLKFQWSYQCQCRPKSYQYDTAFCLGISTAGQLVEIVHSVDPSAGPRYRKRCKSCLHYPIYQSITMPDTTWMVRCLVQNPSLDYINLPNFLSVGASFFKLGYVTFVNRVSATMRHQTSCHLIQDQWFHYDGFNFNGKLKKLERLELPSTFKPESVLYFKWR